jgi:hypothetical protein
MERKRDYEKKSLYNLIKNQNSFKFSEGKDIVKVF